ncbi:hypothetical protein ACWGPW_02700 [Paenibacillus chitinolyticus]
MLKEFKQLMRQPQYLLLFIFAELASVLLPMKYLEGLRDFPSLIFFVMGFNLLFLLYGAEQARSDHNNHIPELIASLPKGKWYYLQKILYWFIFAFIWYVIFLVCALLYVTYGIHDDATLFQFRITLVYTFFNWLVPFFVSLVLGYSIYTLWPSLAAYLVLISIWILLGPYNSFVGFIRPSWLPLLTVGDTNLSITQSYYQSEHMILNDGAFWQRTLAVLVCFFVFFVSIPLLRKGRKARILMIVCLLVFTCLAGFAPSQKITDVTSEYKFNDAVPDYADFTISSYDMQINHGREDHLFSYVADLNVSTKSDQIPLALWDFMDVQSLSWNGASVPFSRDRNLLFVQLPSGHTETGILSFHVRSEKYGDMNPTSFELLSTLPWYPMDPKEAKDPLHHAIKEKFSVKVNVKDFRGLVTNLSKNENQTLTGVAYGPTLLYGPFTQETDLTIPKFISLKEARAAVSQVAEIINSGRQPSDKVVSLPQHGFIVNSRSIFSANPDEYFLTLTKSKIDSNIFRVFFPEKEK